MTTVALLLATGCITHTEPEPQSPSLGADAVLRYLPERLKDRRGWAEDIVVATLATNRAPTAERVCAVVAVIEQESGYQADPVVADLPNIVRRGLLAKLERLGPLAEPALAALLAGKAPNNPVSFAGRIDRLRTERDLDRLFRDIEATYSEKLPGTFLVAAALARILGKGGLQDLNPVTTAGSMQVKVAYARTLAAFSGLRDDELRERLYTRAGGVRAGAARLIDYGAAYDDVVYRFADYNAGAYSSRNAAYQAQLQDLTGKSLALDGDLLSYDADGDAKDAETQTLRAMLAFGRTHDIWDWTIRRDARKEKSEDFEGTTAWTAVRDAWTQKTGKQAPYARVPTVALSAPKLRGTRSTAWYAASVKQRYAACRARD